MAHARTLLLLLALPACLTPGPAPSPRYFRPELAPVDRVSEPPAVRLRVRSIESASRLTERIAWNHGVEYGYHELLRWTDQPDRYVEEALDQELFAAGRFLRTRERAALSLDVRLLAFDELIGSEPAAHVRLHGILEGPEGQVRLERDIRMTRPCVDRSPEGLAAGMGEALGAAVELLAEQLARELGA